MLQFLNFHPPTLRKAIEETKKEKKKIPKKNKELEIKLSTVLLSQQKI